MAVAPGRWRVPVEPGRRSPPTTLNTARNTPLNVAAPGVLANDNANGGGAMLAVLDVTVSPAAGTLVLNTNGGFTYTPAAGFLGAATFTYHASNSNGPSNVATVTVTVADQPPTAANDSYSTPFNTPLVVAAPGVLGNDTNNGGGAMSAAVATSPSSGVLALNADGSFTYTPSAGFSGADSFTYRASNLAGPGNIATVAIAVAAPVGPQPPTNLRVTGMSGNTVTFGWNVPTARARRRRGSRSRAGLAPGEVLGALPLGPAPSVTITLPTGSFYLRVRTLAGGATSAASNEVLTHVNVPVRAVGTGEPAGAGRGRHAPPGVDQHVRAAARRPT